MAPTPVWFITAATSGFGKGIALSALARGHKVLATGRSLSRLADLKEAGADIYELDVTSNIDTLKKTIEQAHSKYGRIDYLINSAGYILVGAVEECSPEECYDQFNTYVFGMMNVARAVLPYMRSQKSGVVANFGSLGSWHGGSGFGIYAGTKWACSGISESMRQELAPLGIIVTVIEPGYFRTGFLNPGAQIQSKDVVVDYDETAVGDMRKTLTKVDNNQPGNVEKGCKVIVDVLTKTGIAEGKEIPVRLVLGSDCQKSIRAKLDETKTLLDEWKDISYSTDY